VYFPTRLHFSKLCFWRERGVSQNEKNKLSSPKVRLKVMKLKLIFAGGPDKLFKTKDVVFLSNYNGPLLRHSSHPSFVLINPFE
jgi:hypothetical protein